MTFNIWAEAHGTKPWKKKRTNQRTNMIFPKCYQSRKSSFSEQIYSRFLFSSGTLKTRWPKPMRPRTPRTTHLSPFFAPLLFFFHFCSFLIDAVFGIGDFSMDGERALGHKVNLILFYWMISDQTTMGPVSHRGPSEASVASNSIEAIEAIQAIEKALIARP